MLSYLIENKHLLPVDLYFAKRLLNKIDSQIALEKKSTDQDLLLFFSFLMASYRNGDVCLNVDLSFDKEGFNSSIFSSIDKNIKVLLEAAFLKAIKIIPLDLIQFSPEKEEYIQKPICQYDNHFYLQKNWIYETKVLQEVILLLKEKPNSFFSEQQFIKSLQERQGLEEAQKKAIRTAFYQRLTLISGGPGTGKTYTASQMIEVFSCCKKENQKFKVLLCAPTGKASFHLKSKMSKELLDKIQLEAMTLHALLKLFPDRLKEFKRDIFSYDLIIVDEASMIDLRIMAFLLSSIDADSRIILIGDKNQLAPIETGQVFAELCESKETVFLEKTHRFSNPTMIQLVKGICSGQADQAFLALDKKDPAVNLVLLNDGSSQLGSYLDHFQSPRNEPFDPAILLDSMQNFQILSSLRQGNLGVDHINKWVSSQLMLKMDKKSLFSNYFAYPIMITSNDYGKNLFNGMMGIVITRVEKFTLPYGKHATAYFKNASGKIIEFSLCDLPQWELGYAISVHKSQGSEFEEIAIIVPDGSESFGKELLYTAVTRARKKLTILAKKPTLTTMIEKSGQKISLLKKRLHLSLEG